MAPIIRLGNLAALLGTTLGQQVVSLLPSIDSILMLQEQFAQLPMKDAAATARAGPILAKQWSANITAKTYKIGSADSLGVSDIHYYYDAVVQRYRMIVDSKQTLFSPNATLHTDQLAINASGLNFNTTIGIGRDAVCKPFHRPYFDMFQILVQFGTSNGSSKLGNHTCEIWQVPVLNISACVGNNGVLLQYNQSMRGYVSVMTWKDTMIGPPPTEVFMPSMTCISGYPTRPCPSNGSTKLDLYRIHSPEEPLSLANRNVGDALGDMAFTCTTNGQGFAGGGGGMEGTVVSWWKVDVNLDFGQYAYCLFDRRSRHNFCYGGTGIQVGRESALGLGKGALQGQCSPNHDVGNWLSFPQAGQCPKGTPLGINGCTWRAHWVRAVNTSCILHNRGLAKTCEEEYGHAPFLKSAAVFEKALASPDPVKGGCPDVEPHVVASVAALRPPLTWI
mmetsp:Transcript_77635/g.150002  ORF Transcript_77635/g.150002 Transcript_77635/m.150002 type:complete len:448 (+) Transcript_77635:63-1406(+)